MSMQTIKQFKKILKIENDILGIYFYKKIPKKSILYKDTACTAMARAFCKGKTVAFNANNHKQLCQVADYFLNFSKEKKQKIADIYINSEHVFKNKKTCKKFLDYVPKFPAKLINKSIVIRPIKKNDNPEIVILLVDPAQASRIIGLLNYNTYNKLEVLPNQPTCLSFYMPIATNMPHINFIDYYDRYCQGQINNKLIWPENKLIISLTYKHLNIILNNLTKSPSGSYKPKITPCKVDKI